LARGAPVRRPGRSVSHCGRGGKPAEAGLGLVPTSGTSGWTESQLPEPAAYPCPITGSVLTLSFDV